MGEREHCGCAGAPIASLSGIGFTSKDKVLRSWAGLAVGMDDHARFIYYARSDTKGSFAGNCEE